MAKSGLSFSLFPGSPVSKSDFFLARRPRFARVVATGRLSRVADRQAWCLIGSPEPRTLKKFRTNRRARKTLCWRHDRRRDYGAPSPDAHAHGDGPPDAHQALPPLPRPEEHGQTPLGQEQHTTQPAGRRPPLPSSTGHDQNIAQARLRGGAARGAAFVRGVVQGARSRRAERIHPLPHVIAPGRSGDGARMPRHRPHRRR